MKKIMVVASPVVQAITGDLAVLKVSPISQIRLTKSQLESIVADGAFTLQEMDYIAKQESESSNGLIIEEF